MLRKLMSVLCCSVMLIVASPGYASLSEEVSLQRDVMQALTLVLQLEAEGLQARQRSELLHSLENIRRQAWYLGAGARQQALMGYQQVLTEAMMASEGGRALSMSVLDQFYTQAVDLLDTWHRPAEDAPYRSVLVIDYLTMRYVFQSHVGIPTDLDLEGDRYYQGGVAELIQVLEREFSEYRLLSEDANLSARWAMLHRLFSDTHERWPYTRSGNAFTPIVAISNARAFSSQLVVRLAERQP